MSTRHIDDQACDEAAQIAPSDEAVGEGGQVDRRVLDELERVVGTRQTRFEVAQHCVASIDPLELRQTARLGAAHHHVLMLAARLAQLREASKAIAVHKYVWVQMRAGPRPSCLTRESCNRRVFELARLALVAEQHREHERHLVLRAATGLATHTLAAKIGVIHLDLSARQVHGVALRHGTHDPVAHQLESRLAHAELALERQRRQPGLALADQVGREKPVRQGAAWYWQST